MGHNHIKCESHSHVNMGHKIGIVNPYHILIKVRCENFSHECEIWSRPRAGRPRTDEFGAYYIKLINISGFQNLNPKSEIIFSKSGESHNIVISTHSRPYAIIKIGIVNLYHNLIKVNVKNGHVNVIHICGSLTPICDNH